MKKKSSVIWIIVALLVLVGLFGGEDTPQTADESTTSVTESTTLATGEDGLITDELESTTNKTETTTNKAETTSNKTETTTKKSNTSNATTTLKNIPKYSGRPYVAINNNIPSFTKSEYTTKAFEKYSPLDSLGRCGVAYACIGIELMPTEDRGSIGQVKPSGWHTVKYDCVDGKYLYNRCHLIGFQLTGENANTRNLITGTRYMNVQGMLPFENMVADYIKETGNHVMYRVTPIFEGKNLLASGVQIEAYSVEDDGDGICFNVYCYNVQPGVVIDYATGGSRLANSTETTTKKSTTTTTNKSDASSNVANSSQYILNTSTKKIHLPSCTSVKKMSEKNKKSIKGSELKSYLNDDYEYCKNCLA